MKKVKNHPNLVRDSQSGAIININQNSYLSAKFRKQQIKKNKERFDQLEKEVQEIKIMLEKILNK